MSQTTSYIFASGYLALMLASVVGAVSCLAPFWIRVGRHGHAEGLWGRCGPTMADCTWFSDSSTPDWLKACQGLFACGVVVLLMTCLTATCHVCCRCAKESLLLSTVIGWIAILGFSALSVSVSLFGIMSARDRGVAIDISRSTDSKFDWAYYAAIASSGSAIVAATLFICDGNRAPSAAAAAAPYTHNAPSGAKLV